MESVIYLDYAATTPQRKEVTEVMLKYFSEDFGNPSSAYSVGRNAKQAVNNARKVIASTINASDKEIYFTSGGTESDNWAIKGVAREYLKKNKKCHIITERTEHHAVLNSCKSLEAEGVSVTYLPVDDKGKVSPLAVEKAIRPETALISVMVANNEIGTIQPIAEISRVAHRHRIPLHVDAVQAYCHIPIDIRVLGIDMMSASGHKFYGPKGIGFLYVREGVLPEAFMDGGMQENKMRAGTENVASIAGMAKAAELAMSELFVEASRERKLRDYFINRIMKEIPYVRLNGAYGNERLANNINISFRFIESESLLIMLDMKGICVSAGSACATGEKNPSHVLTAIGLPEDLSNGSVRFTIGRNTTKEELDITLEALKEAVLGLREASFQYEEFLKNGQLSSDNRRILY